MAKKNINKTRDISANVPAGKVPAAKGKTGIPQREHAAFLDNLSPQIKMQMEEVYKQEDKIRKALADPKLKGLFTTNPRLFFEKAKIEMSPIVKKRIEAFRPDEAISVKTFVMPNGQTIKPNINIKIK